MSEVAETVEDSDDAPPAAPARRGPGRPPATTKPEPSNPAATALAHEDAKTVFDWLRGLGQAGAIRAKLTRLSPSTTASGINCKGYLCEYEEMVDEKEILRVWGGGTFQLQVKVPNPAGGWKHAGQRQFDIGMPPKVPGHEEEREVIIPQAPKPDNDVTKQALGMMADMTRRAEDRAEKASTQQPPGVDWQQVKLMMVAPLETQIANLTSTINNLTSQLAAKDKTIVDLMMRKPDTTFQETMLLEHTRNESAAQTRMRDNHESELRQLRQSHTDELRYTRDAHQRELDARDRAHERELKSLGSANSMIMESGKQGTEARVDALKTQIVTLERQLTEKTAENTTLREKKDKSIVETLGEIASTKEAIDAITGGGDKTEETPVWERVVTQIVDSPFAKAVAHRIENAPAQPPPQPQQQVRRRVIRRVAVDAQGNPVVQAQQAQPAAQQPTNTAVVDQALAEQPAPAADGQPAQNPPAPVKKRIPPPKVSEVELSIAVQYMENAVISGNTTPEDFAASVKSSLDGKIISYIRDAGIDELLRLAKISENSPLNSQHGKNFCRKVAKILVGATE